jgi:uncharacterized lipoprotein YajG
MKRKTKIFLCQIIIMGVVIILANACKKDENTIKLTPTVPITNNNLVDIDGFK